MIDVRRWIVYELVYRVMNNPAIRFMEINKI